MEDTEGFYGLEEIEDVEIVKDPVTGNLTFETTKTEDEVAQDVEEAWQREEDEQKRLEQITFDEEKVVGQDESVGKKLQEADEEVAWEGFSDGEDAPAGILKQTTGADAKDQAGAPATNGEPEVKKLTKTEKKKRAKEAKLKR